jgi:hypothetical protein
MQRQPTERSFACLDSSEMSRSPYPDTCPAPPTSFAVLQHAAGPGRQPAAILKENAIGRSPTAPTAVTPRPPTIESRSGPRAGATPTAAIRPASPDAVAHIGDILNGVIAFDGDRNSRRSRQGHSLRALRKHRRTSDDSDSGGGRKNSPVHFSVLHLKKVRTLAEAHYNAIGSPEFEMILIISEGSMAGTFIACSSPTKALALSPWDRD